MRHATTLVAVLAFVPLTSATAQVTVRPGARVRVTGDFCQPSYSNCLGGRPEHHIGTFVAWKADTLVVQSNGDTLSVPASLVTRLDVSQGRRTNTGTGAGIGFLLGGVVGAVIGYASYAECVPQGWFSCIGPDFGPEVVAVMVGLVGGTGGALFGALIGSAIKTDRWQEVPPDRFRLQVAPQRDGRFGLGASVRF